MNNEELNICYFLVVVLGQEVLHRLPPFYLDLHTNVIAWPIHGVVTWHQPQAHETKTLYETQGLVMNGISCIFHISYLLF